MFWSELAVKLDLVRSGKTKCICFLLLLVSKEPLSIQCYLKLHEVESNKHGYKIQKKSQRSVEKLQFIVLSNDLANWTSRKNFVRGLSQKLLEDLINVCIKPVETALSDLLSHN